MQEWENRKVDEAGYIISTADQISAEANTIAGIATRGSVADFFDAGESAEELRANNARRLREAAARLIAIAESLEGPIIDESESKTVGFDADHSVFE